MMKNDPFEAHDITHLSASSINQFISSPCHWLLKVSGYRSSSSPAMWRGTAIDNAICNSFDMDSESESRLQESIVNAKKDFDRLYNHNIDDTIFVSSEDINKERDKLEEWVNLGVNFYNNLETKPIECQRKIEIEFEDIPIPVIGYIDLTYEDCIRDIKTTARLLSDTPSSICRQLSLYSLAENKPAYVDFLHVTSKKADVVTREITNVEENVSVLRKAAFAMMNLLSYSDDIRTVASLLYPDFDDWRWSDEDIEAAKNLWSIK